MNLSHGQIKAISSKEQVGFVKLGWQLVIKEKVQCTSYLFPSYSRNYLFYNGLSKNVKDTLNDLEKAELKKLTKLLKMRYKMSIFNELKASRRRSC